MSSAKENIRATASCAGEVATGYVMNKNAPLSRIERLEMYKAKKREETVKGFCNTKERNVLIATDTSTANVKKSNGCVKATPHHYTPSPVLARVRKRLEGARPPPARAGARDVASAFKVSMAKKAADNARNVVGKAPITDSQPISTKVPQKAGRFNSCCLKDRSDLLHSQIVEADDLKLKSGTGAARLFLEEMFKQELAENMERATAGDFCLYWAARAILEEVEGKYSEARAILDEGEAYIMHPVQKLVMARVSADFDARQVQLKAKEVTDLLDEGDVDDSESLYQSDGGGNELLNGENEEKDGNATTANTHEEVQDNCDMSFTESDHLVNVRGAEEEEEESTTCNHSQLINEDREINIIQFSSLSIQDKLVGSVQEENEVLNTIASHRSKVENFSQMIKVDMQRLPELPYCNKEEGENDGEDIEIPTTTLKEPTEKCSIAPEKEEEEGRNNLMEPPSPVIPQEVIQQQQPRKNTPRPPPRRSPRLARMNNPNSMPRTPSPIRMHMEDLLNELEA